MQRKITFILFVLFMITMTNKSYSQDLLSQLPETKEQFIASEKNVLATIDWLENTPFDIEQDKRTTQKALLVAWITNSPTVTLELNARVLTFTKKNPDLLITFMGGWVRYALDNNYSKDNIQGSLAGIKSAIKVYKNLSLEKDKQMEKLVELDSKGELEKWVQDQMANK